MMFEMARKEFTSIPVERPQMEQLQAVKDELQKKAGRSLRWSDVIKALLGFREQAIASTSAPDDMVYVEMRQEDDRALTPEELEAMGVVKTTGLSFGLSDEDTERIVGLVVDKILEHLPRLVNDELDRRSP